jgi:hypothetical protein
VKTAVPWRICNDARLVSATNAIIRKRRKLTSNIAPKRFAADAEGGRSMKILRAVYSALTSLKCFKSHDPERDFESERRSEALRQIAQARAFRSQHFNKNDPAE